MTDKQPESLSALMDGELDELSLRRLLSDSEHDSASKAQWARFHMARDAIKGQATPFMQLDISDAVSKAVAQEPTNTVQKPWLKTVAGLSIAASVAFAVVIGARFNPLTQSTGFNVQVAEQAPVERATPNANELASSNLLAQSKSGVDGVGDEALQEAQARLNRYLKQHAQDSAVGQGRTAMPFARVVNFETNKEP